MGRIFFAVYEENLVGFHHKILYKSNITVYRTTRKGLMDELKAQGFNITAILFENDIETLKNDTFSSDTVTESDVKFLKENMIRWEWVAK